MTPSSVGQHQPSGTIGSSWVCILYNSLILYTSKYCPYQSRQRPTQGSRRLKTIHTIDYAKIATYTDFVQRTGDQRECSCPSGNLPVLCLRLLGEGRLETTSRMYPAGSKPLEAYVSISVFSDQLSILRVPEISSSPLPFLRFENYISTSQEVVY